MRETAVHLSPCLQVFFGIRLALRHLNVFQSRIILLLLQCGQCSKLQAHADIGRAAGFGTMGGIASLECAFLGLLILPAYKVRTGPIQERCFFIQTEFLRQLRDGFQGQLRRQFQAFRQILNDTGKTPLIIFGAG